MKLNTARFSILTALLSVSLLASAEVMDKPAGFKIGERMTLRPYVSIGFTYDTNNGRNGDNHETTSWTIDPHLDLDYKAENWNLALGIYYGYRFYNGGESDQNGANWGQTLRWNWSNAKRDAKGWTLMLSESISQTREDDDIRNSTGNGLFRGRMQVQFAGAIQRRFTDKLHGDINASYSYQDYDNDDDAYGYLYGWQRWTAGVTLGYAFTRWTDLLLSGSYQRYYQDNSSDHSGRSKIYGTDGLYSKESQGWTVQAGLGSYATERISYRALAGWSYFEYGGNSDNSCNGFTYSASANWTITDTLNMMLMAQSYYMPSETEYGSANRVDSVSWGLGKSLVRGKLQATLDIAYRRDTNELCDEAAYDYDEDVLSGRIGLNYTLNRFLSLYGNVEYEHCFFHGDTGGDDGDSDYGRFRGNIGIRLTY